MSIFSGIDEHTDASILLTDLDDKTLNTDRELEQAPSPTPNIDTTLKDLNAEDDGALSGEPPELDLLTGLSTVNHDFEYHQPRRGGVQWFWLVANTIALVVLIGQIALWQKAALFASPIGDELRKLCPLHPSICEDPAQKRSSAVTDVVSTKLVVRKHPSIDNALLVDTILLNRGPASTSFPELQLRFSDINDRTIATRSFKPAEYLAGELTADASLASQQPVHIALEIVDPGPAAVNYQLQLLP
tara:strand:+ start:37697 stop:38431 length:735 start_codon:yes stop_codon:yes gene_type:complete